MQETLSLNQEATISNHFQEALSSYGFTTSDERKLQSLYGKCQQNKLALGEIFISYLEEIAPEGKNPYTARQVEQYLHFFLSVRKMSIS